MGDNLDITSILIHLTNNPDDIIQPQILPQKADDHAKVGDGAYAYRMEESEFVVVELGEMGQMLKVGEGVRIEMAWEIEFAGECPVSGLMRVRDGEAD